MRASAREGFFLAMLLAATASWTFAAQGSGPPLAHPAPPLYLSKILQAPPDTSVSWEVLRGQVVVVDFWATWCGPCVKSIPHWNELVSAFKSKPVRFIAITDENGQVVEQFLRKTPIHCWVGLEGAAKSNRDVYNIQGIPTTVIVNQDGIVVAVTHPALLRAEHIDEVLKTRKSSLPPAAEPTAGARTGEDAKQVPATPPIFEASVRRSGPLPPGHGTDCWGSSAGSLDVTREYASVRRAILTMFSGRQTLVEYRVPLPSELYDFTLRLPPGAAEADREQAAATMLRTAFGLQVRREQAEREVYVLTVSSTNMPGLSAAPAEGPGGGGEERGGLQLKRASIDWLPRYFEKWLGKPVINETGVTNRYNIRLRWKMSEAELKGEAEADRNAILAAIREQLGLALTVQRRVMEILIVEKSVAAP